MPFWALKGARPRSKAHRQPKKPFSYNPHPCSTPADWRFPPGWPLASFAAASALCSTRQETPIPALSPVGSAAGAKSQRRNRAPRCGSATATLPASSAQARRRPEPPFGRRANIPARMYFINKLRPEGNGLALVFADFEGNDARSSAGAETAEIRGGGGRARLHLDPPIRVRRKVALCVRRAPGAARGPWAVRPLGPFAARARRGGGVRARG